MTNTSERKKIYKITHRYKNVTKWSQLSIVASWLPFATVFRLWWYWILRSYWGASWQTESHSEWYIFGLRNYDHVSHCRTQLKWFPIIAFQYSFQSFCSSIPNPSAECFGYLDAGSRHRLRSSTNLLLASHPTSFRTYSESFSVHAARLWNRLPTSIRQFSSVYSFRESLKKMWLTSSP